jgi:3-hydroxyisobutyrate dehydrogenase-like beta-hydroxyacid dehydrogenase
MHNCNDNLRPVVAIVSPGEMGVSLGQLLIEHGFPVVTTLEGRSSRTSQRCARVGLRPLPTLDDVVAAADIFLSLVPPDAAVAAAECYCRAASSVDHPPLFVEANSISPASMARIEGLMERCGAPLVDASIHGLAARLREQGTLFLSGPRADDLAAQLAGVLRIEVLGDACGTASLFKMLLGGVSKSLVGLFVEMGLAAAEADLLEPFLKTCRLYYPGVMEIIDRLLPTLPRHARRRAAEMEELQRTLHALGLPLEIAAEIQRLYRLLADSPLSTYIEHIDPSSMTTVEILKLIRTSVPLSLENADLPSSVVSYN